MKTNFFLNWCDSCKKKTAHRIIRISKKRGVRLSCIICGTEKKNYHKINQLVEFKLEREIKPQEDKKYG